MCYLQDPYAATNPPYSDDKDRQRGYNEVLDTKPSINHISSNSWSKDCPPSALQAMGNRLLDWFSVVMAEAKRRRSHNKGKGYFLTILNLAKQVKIIKVENISHTTSFY
jgi:hypothetical protein